MTGVAYFIVQIPKCNILALTKCVKNGDNIIFVNWIVEFDISWALHPLWVMNSGNWIRLFSWFVSWLPAVIKKDKNRLGIMTFKNCKVFKDIFEELRFVV